MDSPQVQLSGSKDPDSNVNSNTNANNEVEMGGTQDPPNDSNPESTAPREQTEAATAMEDDTLPDAQPNPEPPTPAKKSAGFKLLE
jgi:hypothetical protein